MCGIKLREHRVILRGERVVLRPMTENDGDVLAHWNSDPEVLWFSEGDDVQSYSREDVQGIYSEVSQTGFCFMIEVHGRPIGECWLQKMSIDRILAKYPDKDCRRIDLVIGEKSLWGQGYGTDTIKTLTRFGFEQEDADLIFGYGAADYNVGSRRACEKAGFVLESKTENPPGCKAQWEYDFVLSKETYLKMKDAAHSSANAVAGMRA